MSEISSRKKDHIDICINEDVDYKDELFGFDHYVFEHHAATEVDIEQISFSTKFFNHRIDFPFLISCMTGGTKDAESINERLAIAAQELNIPIGVGSQRQALENDDFIDSYKKIRDHAKNVPVLSNIGAAQVAKMKGLSSIRRIIEMVDADVLVIHLNPFQELLQPEGETDFTGLKKNIEKICSRIEQPVIVKEVGAGIAKKTAKDLLELGVDGIDVSGASGTSWAAVELLRSNKSSDYFRNWGLPTSYCVRTVAKLKSDYDFMLISSGGISSFDEAAKSYALGADITASAKSVLRELMKNDIEGVVNFIQNIFENIKKIMYLTGSQTLADLNKSKLIKKGNLY